MTGPATDDAPEGMNLPVKWNAEDWAKLKAAADLRTAAEGFRVTPTDIIRSGALRRAEEVLAGAEAA